MPDGTKRIWDHALNNDSPKSLNGTRTLIRGLEILSIVSMERVNVPTLAERLGLTRSTAHRLASTLVEHRYLNFAHRQGYSLGPRLLELGHLAAGQMNLPRIAHDFLCELAKFSGDTVHLGILDDDRVLYLDKVPGSRRIEISSRIGERQPLRSTGLGKALLLDASDRELSDVYRSESARCPKYGTSEHVWLERMRHYRDTGFALDLEENEDRIRCVAAPIRDAANSIIGAVSISSAAQYMNDARMFELTRAVMNTVISISLEFGWRPGSSTSVAEGN